MMDDKPVSSIAQAIMAYMQYSEQLDTYIVLSSNATQAAGILIQKLPNTGGKISPTPKEKEELRAEWQTIKMLVDTVQDEELLTTSPQILMRRLFLEAAREQDIRSFPIRKVQFSCQCSREKVGNMMLMLGKDEVAEILAEQNKVETTCDFCGQVYLFDLVDCQQLFAGANTLDRMRPASGSH
jgi:molecular chaperone Hsp33